MCSVIHSTNICGALPRVKHCSSLWARVMPPGGKGIPSCARCMPGTGLHSIPEITLRGMFTEKVQLGVLGYCENAEMLAHVPPK